ncbi:hypothetical protein KIL84_009955 [Mauremys mutica]|uniref:Uncharacterized protein n=1 Tax=Mauremys mutica TaxID=74926 RepID=A0A9D3XLT9_9SAUR|nr:hypothetical protein KIL84_009955 [Mauremys mutica]
MPREFIAASSGTVPLTRGGCGSHGDRSCFSESSIEHVALELLHLEVASPLSTSVQKVESFNDKNSARLEDVTPEASKDGKRFGWQEEGDEEEEMVVLEEGGHSEIAALP